MATLILKVGIKRIIKKYYVKIFKMEIALKDSYVFMHMENNNLNNMHSYKNRSQHYKKIMKLKK